MRSILFAAFWLSSVVSAELITITEWRKCSTSVVFTAPSYNSTQTPNVPATPSASSSSTTTASARPTLGPLLGAANPGAAANNIDFLYWLEFANAIRAAVNIAPDSGVPFFIGSTAQQGPLAGDNIPAGYTNYGIYKLGDNLLSDGSIFYQPSASNSYFEALNK